MKKKVEEEKKLPFMIWIKTKEIEALYHLSKAYGDSSFLLVAEKNEYSGRTNLRVRLNGGMELPFLVGEI